MSCLLLLLAFWVPVSSATGASAWEAAPEQWGEVAVAEVIRVIDGDTIEVRLDGEMQTVRYLGIDAPEIDWARGQHQVYALEAAEANRKLVLGEWVRLVFDTVRYDGYGRLLAHVFVGDLHVNFWLIEQGYAQAFFVSPNLQYHAEFLEAQRNACLVERGLWGTLGRPIAVRQVSEYVGTFQVVEGQIVHGQQRADGVVELLLSDDSTGLGSLYIHIYPEARTWFESSPDVSLIGSRVQVIGLIEYYGRSYRIVVRDPAMLLALDGSTTDVAVCGR